MARKIREPLEMSDGTKVNNLDELKAHSDSASIVDHYMSGKLLKWLQERYYTEEANAVAELDILAPDLEERLGNIFGFVPAKEPTEEELLRAARQEKLRAYTEEAYFMQNIDRVAFDQDELYDLLDENATEIILCGAHFEIPYSQKGIQYKGIGKVEVHLTGKLPSTRAELEITLENVECDNFPPDENSGSDQEREEESDRFDYKKIDAKMEALFGENAPTRNQVIFITDQYMVVNRKDNPNDFWKKDIMARKAAGNAAGIFRVDLLSMAETRLPDKIYGYQWENISHELLGCGNTILCKKAEGAFLYDLETMSHKHYFQSPTRPLTFQTYCITSEYILLFNHETCKSVLMDRNTGEQKTINIRPDTYHYRIKLFGDELFWVEEVDVFSSISSILEYKPVMAKMRKFNVATEEASDVCEVPEYFHPMMKSGNLLYGATYKEPRDEKDVFVVDLSTGAVTNLRSQIKYLSGDSYHLNSCTKYWVLCVESYDLKDRKYQYYVYSILLENAELRSICTGIHEDEIIGVVGDYFYTKKGRFHL